MINKYIVCSEEVNTALEKGIPIVALESTIISHGMPYPNNKETACAVEGIIRERKCCPATIAVIDGYIKVGLSIEELELLASTPSSEILKLSVKDIPYAIVGNQYGACTVAATSYIAAKVGIRVFATGGIGGVHRGAQETMDISADLAEIARTPMAVVCAGAKSILDLALTLEYLETHSIPVIGYNTQCLPAFYTRTSPHPLDIVLSNAKEIADFLNIQWDIQARTGAVIVNPIPEEYSLDEEYIDTIIEEAISLCDTKHIKGKAVTPFLLSYIAERTEQNSLFSNIALVKNNAMLAADIAQAL